MIETSWDELQRRAAVSPAPAAAQLRRQYASALAAIRSLDAAARRGTDLQSWRAAAEADLKSIEEQMRKAGVPIPHALARGKL